MNKGKSTVMNIDNKKDVNATSAPDQQQVDKINTNSEGSKIL